MQQKHAFSFLLLSITIAATAPLSTGEDFYSYFDSSGAQVFTNIPPSYSGKAAKSIITQQNKSKNQNVYPENQKTDPRIFDPIINKYASYYELEPSLIHSIIETESGFNPNAVSSKGARGLMQLMPTTAERLGVENSFDPDQNIHAGVRHFRSLMDMFNNNLDLSLAAYNAGENLVRRLGRVPKNRETINYVRSVTRRYRERRKNEQEQQNHTYKYVDTAGVLHLTNIPPAGMTGDVYVQE
jgi:soluble lytic murein transglycosylase-like protein